MRFSIRDLLWLILAVALGLAWWQDRGQMTRRYAATMAHAEKLRTALIAARDNQDVLQKAVRRRSKPNQSKSLMLQPVNWNAIYEAPGSK
jgi:hypothetical protein